MSFDKQRPEVQENPPCSTQVSEIIMNGEFSHIFRPVIQLWCPRPKSNMDDFSVLSGPYVHVEATQEK